MRLFLSLRPPAEVRDHLLAALDGLRTTDPPRWHVTLVFLGEVTDPAPLLPGLASAASAAPALSLHLAGGGFFRSPGVLYATVGGDADRLAALAADLADAGRAGGVVLEDRPFRPHLTVARRLPRNPGVLAGYRGPAWTAADVELVRSHLGRQASHEVIARFPLTG